MAIALAAFSILIIVLSAWGCIKPDALIGLVRRVMSGGGMTVAVVARLLLAALLWLTASVSQTPLVFRVLAIVALLAAIGLPIVGTQRVSKLIEWFADRPSGLVRAWCLAGVAFGGFMLWSIGPAIG